MAGHRADAGKHHLPAVSMAGEHRGHLQRGRFGGPPWIMREQDHGIRGLAEHPRDVFQPARPETYAWQFQPFAPYLELRPRLFQHLDPVP